MFTVASEIIVVSDLVGIARSLRITDRTCKENVPATCPTTKKGVCKQKQTKERYYFSLTVNIIL